LKELEFPENRSKPETEILTKLDGVSILLQATKLIPVASDMLTTTVVSVNLKSPASSVEGKARECLIRACAKMFTERLVWLSCLDTGSGT
jgi:hypothetical protein